MTEDLVAEEIEEGVDYDGDPVVFDDLTCDKHMRHMQYWHNEHARIKQIGEKQIWELQQRLESRLKTINNKIKFHEAACGNWFTSTGKKKWSGVFGKMRIRKGSERIDVEDLSRFVAWANGHGAADLYKTTYTVNKKDARAFIKEMGEIPDGLDLTRGEDKLEFDLFS